MHGFNVEAPGIELLNNCFIEASAGTGKTHTLKTLILRMIIEKGIALSNILVVTFTRLSTKELKMRIREALKESYDLVLQKKALPAYLEEYVQNEEARDSLLRKIKGALSSMDSAKIMTIHGFAAYLLNTYQHQHSLFSEESVASPHQLLLLIKDFLRTELLPEDVALWQQELLLQSHYRGDFERFVFDLANLAVKRIPIQAAPFYQERLNNIRGVLSTINSETLVEEFVRESIHYGGVCNRSKEIKEEVLAELQKLARFVERIEEPPIFKELFKFHPSNKLKKACDVKPLYKELLEQLQELNDPLLIFAQIAEKARLYLLKVIEKEGLIFYDDLLLQAAKLVENIQVQRLVQEEFKVALIDEFQDTDSLQWKIFSTLFLKRESVGSLVVVGDPKQSIYRFRLADLYTYMEAKKSFQNHYSLNVNYRSKPRIVESLNRLFSDIDEFLVLPETGESFPCPAVQAKECKGEDDSALYTWSVESEEQLFSLVAKEIILLHTTKNKALSDCAVLVKDRHQMKRLKEAFAKVHLPLAQLRDEPITLSRAFILLKEFIDALLSPHDRSKRGKVLLSPLFGVSLDEIEEADKEILSTFFTLSEILKEKGLLFAMQDFMKEWGPSFISRPKGERLYSDLMQLIELAEEKGIKAEELPLFYEKLVENNDHESLAPRPLGQKDAVWAMTIHMSKGLEFDVVFPIGLIVPFVVRRELIYSSKEKKYLLGEGVEEMNCEKMRLTYVALTRAKSLLYLPSIVNEKKIDGRSSCIDYFMSKRASLWEPTHSFVGQTILPLIFHAVNEKALSFASLSLPDFSSAQIASFSSLFPYSTHNKECTNQALPLGAHVGTLLHELLEKISFTAETKALLIEEITPHLTSTFLSKESEMIAELLFQTFHKVLESKYACFTLADLKIEEMQKEVAFCFIEGDFGSKGVIDLFFSYEGRYYFLDWKSNYLNEFSQENLEREMQECHYYEQAKMYKEGIRRYLSLIDERPFEELFGGFFYLFLRGAAVIYGE